MNQEQSTSKTGPRKPRLERRAFTLIELLVVIAIIGVLASLSLVGFATVKRKATFKRVEGELGQLANAIETYKIDKGFYPPDNSDVATFTEPNVYANLNTPAARNALYYELGGVLRAGTASFRSLVDDVIVAQSALQSAFDVSGVMNANVGGSQPKNYLQSFKSTQYSNSEEYTGLFPVNIPPPGVMVMSTIIRGPLNPDNGPSPFCYASSSRYQRNTTTFDLWVDVIVGSETNRISNWSEEREIVDY